MPRTKEEKTAWRPWHVRLHYADGRSEVVVVLAESISSMVLSLPRFADVGKYRYEVLKVGTERSKMDGK